MGKVEQCSDQDIMRLMRSHAYFHGLEEDVIGEVAAHVAVRRFAPGEIVFPAHEPVTQLGFLVAGRLKGVVVNPDGDERLLKFAERGEAVGLISAAMVEPLPVTTLAVEPSTILMLDYDRAIELTAKHPDLRSHWNQKLAGALRAAIIGDSRTTETTVIGVFHQSEQTRPLTSRIVASLLDAGNTIGAFTDNADGGESIDCRCRTLIDGGSWISEGQVHEQIGAWGKPSRIIVDVSASCDTAYAKRLLSLSQTVLWIGDEQNHSDAASRLQSLEADAPAVRDKVSFVWALRDGLTPPLSPSLAEVSHRSFVLPSAEPKAPFGPASGNGFQRLLHHLQGVRVGLALGGGAARGMAHLGVLRALEKNGIIVDRISGTSAGAMTGLLYAAGFKPDYIVERFVEDLQPPWLFRHLPKGGYWYLTYKYRRGQFDGMLRQYLKDLRVEQLPIPASAVTVDLVSGRVIIRETGDAVHAVLDSINLPLLSKPILRNGQALIDGGFVNNVPADVLVSQGCNLVIAVDVLAKIEQEFAGMRPESDTNAGRSPSSLQTILRTYAVQSFNMNSVGAQPADVRIEPDTTFVGMPDFTRARELADVGEQTALESLPAIKSLLKRLVKRS